MYYIIIGVISKLTKGLAVSSKSSQNIMSQNTTVPTKGIQVATCVGLAAFITLGTTMGSYAEVPSNNLPSSNNTSAKSISLVDTHIKPHHGRLGVDMPKDTQEATGKSTELQTDENKAHNTEAPITSETNDIDENRDAQQSNELPDAQAGKKEAAEDKAAESDIDDAVSHESAAQGSSVEVKTVATPATSDESNPLVYGILAGVGVLLAIFGYLNKKDNEK